MPCLTHKKTLLFLTFLAATIIILSIIPTQPSYAQSKFGDTPYVYDLADKDAEDGDILIMTEQGLTRSSAPLDTRIYGVVQNNVLLVYKREDNQGLPVVRNGIAMVNVTTFNGAIKPGDYITSSEILGKGQKADQSGYILGIAISFLEEDPNNQTDYHPDYAPDQSKKVTSGKVLVATKVEFVELSSTRSILRLLDYFNAALLSSIKDPTRFVEVFRYIAAATVILASFGIGFITFSRSLPKAIEAVGRNPLAAKTIRLSIILNIFFTVVIGLIGIIAALVIVKI